MEEFEDETLWLCIQRVATDVIKKASRYIGQPTVDSDHSGIRTDASGLGPARLFFTETQDGQSSPLDYESLDGLHELVSEFMNRPAIAKKFASMGDSTPELSDIIYCEVAAVPLALADRYFSSGLGVGESPSMESLYLPIERYLLDPDLRVDVEVPILGITFTGVVPENPGFSIMEISNDARAAMSTTTDVSREDMEALMAATHSLVIENVGCIPLGYGEYFVVSPNAASEAAIDRFFTAMTIGLRDHPTFAQILCKPRGWVVSGVGSSQDRGLHVLRDYGVRLDRVARWPVKEYDESSARFVYQVATELESAHPSVRVAARRIVTSWERESDEDRIIDLCIGLEAMLGAGMGETVHRISLRAAALLTQAGGGSSKTVYTAMKEMYSYRSRVVHGTPGPHKKDLLQIDGIPIHASRFALSVLRSLVNIALADSTFSPEKIDEEFIFSALDAASPIDE